MSEPKAVHLGKGFIAYDVVLIGVGFPPGYDLKGFCIPTVEALLKISPFSLSREAMAFWCVDSRDMGWFEETGNRVTGAHQDSLVNAFMNFQAIEPRFPPWHHCAQIGLRRGGMVVIDYRDRGYADLVPSTAGEDMPGPARSLCELVRFGDPSTEGFAFALAPALPLGGSVLEDPSRPGQVRAAAAQVAKGVGLLLGLGDEFEGLDDDGIFEGTNAALALNLHSPAMYGSIPANTSDGANRTLASSVGVYWKRYSNAKGFDILESAQSALAEGKILVVHYDAEHISRTPMGPELEPAGSIRDGVHLIEGGAGWRRGVYRTRPNCIMRFPWRFTPSFEIADLSGTFDEVSFCKPCESILQEILVGYSSFKLGQMVVAPSGVDGEPENSLGHLLADFVGKEGTDQPDLPSYAAESSHVAALARISQFFATMTRLRIEYSRQYRVVNGAFEPVAEPLGPDELGVTLPAVRARPAYDSDILWAQHYAAGVAIYSDVTEAVAVSLASGIAGAIEATGMGRIMNGYTEPGSLEYAPLRSEVIDQLPPGTVLELWIDRSTAIQAVTNHATTVPESDHKTVILLRDDSGSTFADHTGINPKSLLDGYGFIFAARWFGYHKAAVAPTSESVRSAAMEAAASKSKGDTFNRLERVIWAESVGEPQLSQEAEQWYGTPEYETTGQYVADLGLLRGTITRRAVGLASSIEYGVDKLIERVEAAYSSHDDGALLREDLAWSLGFLATILPAWIDYPYVPGGIPGVIGWRGFWEHTSGVSTPFSALYPNPTDFSTMREFIDSAVDLPQGLDAADFRKALWSRVSIRHPIVLAIHPSPTDLDYNNSVVPLISAIFASEPAERDARVQEFVETRLEAWRTANAGLKRALADRTEGNWYLLLPLLGNAATEEVGRWTYPNLHEYVVEVVIKEHLAPQAGRDDAWETVGEFAAVLGLAAMVLIPYAGATAGGATLGAAGSATLSFEAVVVPMLAGADALLTVAVAGRDVYQGLEFGDDSENLRRIEELAPVLFGEQRDLITNVDSGVLTKLFPILLLVGATGLGSMTRWAASLRRIRTGFSRVGLEDLLALKNRSVGLPNRPTLGVANTDIDGLEWVVYEGVAPTLRRHEALVIPQNIDGTRIANARRRGDLDGVWPERPFKTGLKRGADDRHAEEEIVNRLDDAFRELSITPQSHQAIVTDGRLSNRTVYLEILNKRGVCHHCSAGLGLRPRHMATEQRDGVLKQFSTKYPQLTIRIRTASGRPAVRRASEHGGSIQEFVLRDGQVITE